MGYYFDNYLRVESWNIMYITLERTKISQMRLWMDAVKGTKVLSLQCDVGLIFLDYRFTIPNYPSRLLSYLTEKKPIIAATDPNCDTGSIAESNGYGYWCPSNDVDAFSKCVDKMLSSNIEEMGNAGYRYFLNHYTVDQTYITIVNHIIVK